MLRGGIKRTRSPAESKTSLSRSIQIDSCLLLSLPESVFLHCLELALSSLHEAVQVSVVCRLWKERLHTKCRLRAVVSDWKKMNDDVLASLSFNCIETLNLAGCYELSDASLPFLSSSIKKLTLAGCMKITNIGGSSVYRLRLLTEVNFSYCADITDCVLNTLSQCCSLLTILYLKDCVRVTDEGVKCLSSLVSLTDVDLDGCLRITDESVRALSALPLQILHFSNCKLLSDVCFSSLKFLTELKKLNMDHCANVSDDGLLLLSSITTMQELNFNGCKKICDLAWMNDMRQLKELHLAGCNISDFGLQSVSNLTQLQAITLNCCFQVSDHGVIPALSGLSSLHYLALGSNLNFTDHLLNFFVGNMTQLEHLDLGNCSPLSDLGLRNVSSLRSLKELILARCYKITDDTILTMNNGCNLTELHLGACRNLSDTTLRFVASHWLQLTKLNLERCNKISDQGVSLLSVLTDLRRLNLAHCVCISDSGVTPLLLLTNLQHLALEGTAVSKELALTFPKFVASHLLI